MARLPEFLSISAAGRVRLALPTARLAIIAFSFTLAAVGMGAFVATLPSASAVDSVIDGAAAFPDAASDDAQRADPTLQDDATQDAAPAEEGDAASGDPSASGGFYSTPGGTLAAPVSSGSGVAASSGTSSSSGATVDSDSSSGAPSGGAASAGSGSSSSSNVGSSSGADSGTVDPSDPFSATPAAAETAASNRGSSPASAGFSAVSSRALQLLQVVRRPGGPHRRLPKPLRLRLHRRPGVLLRKSSSGQR